MASIMIVDDSITIRRALRNMLVKNGHNIVAEAGNGEEAVAKYKAAIPEIVTMDLNMPVMNGVTATQKIITMFPDASIIMLSSVKDKNLVVSAVKCGAKSYILKPVEETKLIEAINTILKNKKGSGE